MGEPEHTNPSTLNIGVTSGRRLRTDFGLVSQTDRFLVVKPVDCPTSICMHGWAEERCQKSLPDLNVLQRHTEGSLLLKSPLPPNIERLVIAYT